MIARLLLSALVASTALPGCASPASSAVVVRFENHDARQVIEASETALAWIVDHGYDEVDRTLAVDRDEPAASARWTFAAFGDRTVAVTPFARPAVHAAGTGEPVVVGAWARCRSTPLEPQYQSAESAAWAWIAALEHALGARVVLLVDRPSADDERRLHAARAMLADSPRASATSGPVQTLDQ